MNCSQNGLKWAKMLVFSPFFAFFGAIIPIMFSILGVNLGAKRFVSANENAIIDPTEP